MIKIKKNVLKCKIADIVIFSIALAIILFTCAIFDYVDCRSLTAQSIEIWDALFSGRIREYFLVTAENTRNAPHGGNVYGILYLIPWAIWNFPVWITHISPNDNILTPICLYWSKMFLVICSICTAFFVYKSMMLYTANNKLSKIAAFLSLGAGSLLISVSYSGQDEIVYVLSMIIGIYSFLEGKKSRAVVFWGIAVVLCPLMLIPIIAMILVIEKNILKILLYLICYILPNEIFTIICGGKAINQLVNSPAYKMAPVYGVETYYNWFFGTITLPSGLGNLSIFAVLIVIAYIICYFKKQTDEEKKYWIIAIPAVILALGICELSWVHFYRYYICVPFLVLAVLISCERKKDTALGVFILVLMEAFRTLVSLFSDVNFSYQACLLNNFTDAHAIDGNPFYTILRYFSLPAGIMVIISSCYFAVTLFAAYLILKQNRGCYNIVFPVEISQILYLMINIILVLCFIVLWKNFYIQDYAIGASSNLSGALNNQNGIYQEYMAKGNKLEYIEVRSVTWNRVYPETEYLLIELIDENNNNLLTYKKVPVNEFPNNDGYRIKMNVDTQVGGKYVFHFEIKGATDNEETWLCFLKSEDDMASKNKLYGYETLDERHVFQPYNIIASICER